MFKTMMLALLLAFQAAPAAAQEVDLNAAQFAGALQGMVGQTFEGGLFIAAIGSEDNILVVTLDGPSGWRGALPSGDASPLFMTGFCEDRSFNFFSGGKSLRVDTLEDGRDRQIGPVVTHCP
jgi:hypothetical protein